VNDIFWIKGNPPAPLAIVLRPRGDDWLEEDLLRLKRGGIETVVSMLEEDEAVLLALGDESVLAEKIGLQFMSFPIPDTQVPPDTAAFRSFVAGLATRLRAGERIGVHCRGSIGRSTVIAACTLIQLGWTPKTAMKAIEAARGLAVPDTQEQADWILSYSAQP
jgi:protein-tyrosine phosphatase